MHAKSVGQGGSLDEMPSCALAAPSVRYRRPMLRNQRLSGLALALVVAVVSASCSSSNAVESGVVSSAQPSPTQVEPAVSTAPTTNATAQVSETTTTVPLTTTVPPTTDVPRTALECAADIAIEVRVGQLLFPVLVQSEMGTAAALAERGLIGGVVVLGTPTAAIADDIADLQARSMVSPSIIAVDEEGGRVQRLEGIVGSVPSARDVAATMTVAQARELAKDHADAIAELGFTMNLAPVVDLDNGEFIKDRSFGVNVDVVTDYAFATADGILEAGLTPVVKHFPGHGRGRDSHTGLPTLPSLDTLRGSDLVPFERAIERGDLPIMVGHLVVPGLTDGKPATLSPEAIDGLLRTELGFDGLVMTDALNMDAISATLDNAEAAELAVIAGNDLVMLGSVAAVEGTIERLVDAVEQGRIEESTVNESFLRVIETRGIDLCSLPPDLLPAIGCQPDVGGCSSG